MPPLKRTLFSSLLAGFAAITFPAQADTYQYETFDNIDVDRSGLLENGEYSHYAFGKADWDKDGYLEESEWVKYTELYYDPYELDYDSYTEYDTNGDGFIDYYEFNEFPTASLLQTWDFDDDNRVTDRDWDQVSAYYRDRE